MYKLLKRNNRKGVFDQVQLAIIAMAAILIFVIFLYKAYANISEKMATQDCKNSITAHSLVAQGSFSEIFTDIKCPTREITIKKLNKANEIIAEDMHRCWYIWDQGKGQYFEGDGTFCHICSIYQFGDKGQNITGLNDYLIRNDIKVKYAGETPGIKYIDYFQGYSTPNADRKVDANSLIPVELDTINTSARYATIFVYASGKDAIDKVLENGMRTTSITGLSLFGIVGGSGAMTAAGAAAKATTTAIFLQSTTAEGVILESVLLTTAEAAAYGGIGATAGGTVSIAATTTTGTVLGLTPIGWVAIGTIAVGAAGYGIYTLLDTPDPEWMAYITFRPYNAEELKALGCEKMVVNQMSNVGTP